MTLTAKWEEGHGLDFSDVSESAWYKPASDYCSYNGYIMGTGEGSTFSPNVKCSRATIVTILYIDSTDIVWINVQDERSV